MSSNHAQGELLAQVNPSVTSAGGLFVTQELRVEVTLILVVNRNAGAQLCSIYHDDDGTTYSAATEILRRSIPAGVSEIVFQAQHPGSGIMMLPGGSLGAQVAAANDLTISVYGITETLAERVRGIN